MAFLQPHVILASKLNISQSAVDGLSKLQRNILKVRRQADTLKARRNLLQLISEQEAARASVVRGAVTRLQADAQKADTTMAISRFHASGELLQSTAASKVIQLDWWKYRDASRTSNVAKWDGTMPATGNSRRRAVSVSVQCSKRCDFQCHR